MPPLFEVSTPAGAADPLRCFRDQPPRLQAQDATVLSQGEHDELRITPPTHCPAACQGRRTYRGERNLSPFRFRDHFLRDHDYISAAQAQSARSQGPAQVHGK